MHTSKRLLGCAALLLASCGSLSLGCVTESSRADALMRSTSAARASAPLGGEALAQRKTELARTFRDLSHMNTTLESLRWRDDRESGLLFGDFVELHLEKQVFPVLEGEWQSRHPEVAALDADVRLAVAELWMRTGSGSRTDRMRDDSEDRFEGRSEMLVSYPLGSQGTLRDAVAHLRDRSWWDR
jgi:hypothetical protein